MWGHFLGYGFTKPIDDMGPHNPPTHPELLDQLAGELRTHSYDLKQLIRWIVLSEPYGLSSMSDTRNHERRSVDRRKADVQPLLSAANAGGRIVRIAVAGDRSAKGQGPSNRSRNECKEKWLSQFTVAFGTDDNEETTTFNGTIQQSLMMMNGELMRQAPSTPTRGLPASRGQRLPVEQRRQDHRAVSGGLGPQADQPEIAAANQLLVARNLDPAAALQDVWWAILNSNEFILNH